MHLPPPQLVCATQSDVSQDIYVTKANLTTLKGLIGDLKCVGVRPNGALKAALKGPMLSTVDVVYGELYYNCTKK